MLNLPRDRHLDVGCGDGVRIRKAIPEGAIIGIDTSDEMLEAARSRGITISHQSVESMPFNKDTFDLVTAIEVFEHIEHPTLALAEIKRVLKPHGFFVCVTPSDSFAFELIWKAWTSFGMGRFWKGKHVHKYTLWGQTGNSLSLIDYLRDAGFRPEKTGTANYGMVIGVRSVKI